MSIVGWVEQDTVGAWWPDAAQLDDDVLASYLLASYEQCVEYLTPQYLKTYPSTIPASWQQAQIMQARALYRSTVSGSGDQQGGYGESVTVFPMDWTVRNLLRPRKIGRVG